MREGRLQRGQARQGERGRPVGVVPADEPVQRPAVLVVRHLGPQQRHPAGGADQDAVRAPVQDEAGPGVEPRPAADHGEDRASERSPGGRPLDPFGQGPPPAVDPVRTAVDDGRPAAVRAGALPRHRRQPIWSLPER